MSLYCLWCEQGANGVYRHQSGFSLWLLSVATGTVDALHRIR